ncbi:hypothetical protein GOV13_05680 [Candidatus Pacearchaeota archaeon]|nr:hypothetical protein [Candidatus Pacearchaeota archaeon]
MVVIDYEFVAYAREGDKGRPLPNEKGWLPLGLDNDEIYIIKELKDRGYTNTPVAVMAPKTNEDKLIKRIDLGWFQRIDDKQIENLRKKALK